MCLITNRLNSNAPVIKRTLKGNHFKSANREMKRIILTATAVTIFSGILFSQSSDEYVNWYSFEEAVEMVSENPKKIFIDIYADWCGWCRRMDQETFSNPDVADYLNKHFYPVKLNAETTDTIVFQGHEFVNEGNGSRSAHQLPIAILQGKMSYPSVAYMDENLQLLTVVPGFRTPENIEPLLRFFGEDHYKSINWEEFSKSFNGTFNSGKE